jgi:hypothetical protein
VTFNTNEIYIASDSKYPEDEVKTHEKQHESDTHASYGNAAFRNPIESEYDALKAPHGPQTKPETAVPIGTKATAEDCERDCGPAMNARMSPLFDAMYRDIAQKAANRDAAAPGIDTPETSEGEDGE